MHSWEYQKGWMDEKGGEGSPGEEGWEMVTVVYNPETKNREIYYKRSGMMTQFFILGHLIMLCIIAAGVMASTGFNHEQGRIYGEPFYFLTFGFFLFVEIIYWVIHYIFVIKGWRLF